MSEELRPYDPTLRDRLGAFLLGEGRASPEYARVVEGLVGSRGLGSLGAVNLADLTPGVAQAFAADELPRARTLGEAFGPALALTPAALAGGAAVYRAAKPALLGEISNFVASRSPRMYNPPAKPARAFAEDYKSLEGVADEAGKLIRTIDGDPITAKYVVGRQDLGGGDVALPSGSFDEIAKAGTGSPILGVPQSELGRDVGRVAVNRYSRLPVMAQVSQGLQADQRKLVAGHEIGHVIDQLAGELPTKGVVTELEGVYNSLNNIMRNSAGTDARESAKSFSPKNAGYSSIDQPRELWAEFARAYMADPNYVKTAAPNAAKEFRKAVNTLPQTKDVVQFNSLAPIAAAGVGGAAIMAEGGEAKAAERQFIPVDHDPFATPASRQNGAPNFVPVDHDPFAPGARPSTRYTPDQLAVARAQVEADGDAAGAGMLGLARSVPIAEQIGSALDYTTGMGQGKGATSYAETLARNRAMIDAYDEKHRVAGMVGQVVGALALPGGGLAAQGVKGAAKLGGLYGAAFGAGEADDLTNVGDVAGRAVIGGVAGGVGGAALAKGGQMLAEKLAPTVAPKISEALRAAQEIGVPIPRFVASDNRFVQQAGEMSRNLPFVGGAITKAGEKLIGDLEGAVGQAADRFGASAATSVANRIGTALDDASIAETRAAQRALEARAGALTTGADAAELAARGAGNGAFGTMTAREAGGQVAGAIRSSEQAARAAKDAAYRDASGAADTFADSNFVAGVGQRIRGALEEQGRVVDPVLTPAASRMVDEAGRVSQMIIPNKATTGGLQAVGDAGEISGVSLKGLESTRRRLNAMAQAATNDADRAAARVIVREFDNHVGDAFERAMLSGDPAALESLKAARAANAEWRTRFGFNGRDDADKIINKVVGGEISEQELANYLVGSTQVGARGVATRLVDRIMEATGSSDAAKSALRASVWTRLSHQIEGVTPPGPDKIASNIFEFVGGSGSQVADKLFSPAEKAILKGYALELRSGVAARGQAQDMLKAGVERGPMAQLARDVLGSRGRSDESLFTALEAMARSGSRGDIQTLSRVMSAIPRDEQANLAGAMARKLGVSPRTGEWSPDVFVSQWNSYTPQAKALLFGMAGEARAALDNIATVSAKYADVKRTFGNPSGTAKNALGGVALFEPLSAIKALGGGAIMANMLAKPAAVTAVSNWSRAYERLMLAGDSATPHMIKFVGTAGNSALRQLGVDPAKMLPGPRASYAEHDQEIDRRRAP